MVQGTSKTEMRVTEARSQSLRLKLQGGEREVDFDKGC